MIFMLRIQESAERGEKHLICYRNSSPPNKKTSITLLHVVLNPLLSGI